MKRITAAFAGAALVAVMATACAGPRAGMGMGGMMAGMSEEQKDKHLRSMQEHMLKMHDLSNQILAEKEATKKEQLKAQQLQLMKEHHAQMMEHHKEMKHPPKK